MKLVAAALSPFFLAVAITQPGNAQENQRHPFTVPHVLRFSGGEDITGLNPHFDQQIVVGYMDRLTMAYLLRFDASNRPIPELATEVPTKANGGVSPDGKTITYRLRHDAKWSDGEPFTSADVAYSVDVVKNPKNGELGIDDFRRITRVDTPDAYTVAFHLTRPDALFYSTFSSGGAGPCILPKHLFGGSSVIVNAPYNALPVGIGPFKFSKWTRGESVELIADPQYFRGRPKLDKVIYKIITNENTVMTQMTTHELDLWMPTPSSFVARVRALPGIDVRQIPGYGYSHIDFNETNPALRDPIVRQALRYATDRVAVRDKVFHKNGVLQESVIAATHPYFNPSIALVKYDPAKANALLDRDGWVRGSDGIRAKNGVRLSFRWASVTGFPDLDQTIELIRTWWKPIGVEFEVQRYLSSILFGPDSSGGILNTGKFDITEFSWGGEPTADQQSVFACDHQPPKGQNTVHYCNPIVDGLIFTYETNNDAVVQKAALQKIQAIIAHDVPVINMSTEMDSFVYNSDLRNFRTNQVSVFDDVMDMDI